MSKRVLLIIGGGIAAYKVLDLIRGFTARGHKVVPVLTKAASEFVTPMSVSALAAHEVHQDLFDLTTEAKMGHIALSRSADIIVVAPATADMLAKMAQGHANDLATTLLLAAGKQIVVAPAMNVKMWEHPATQRNVAQLKRDGVIFIGPEHGAMACGEVGEGRLSAAETILAEVERLWTKGPLKGRHIVVTSGPTHEPIDPVRYIANRSSGEQGTQIARAFIALGADVTFITGPADVPPPSGVQLVQVQTAQQMFEAVKAALPADVAICAAAVADWRVTGQGGEKIKKGAGGLSALSFEENPDILQFISQQADVRPQLVIGFAAETQTLYEHARAKLLRKGCDWIVANDVSEQTGIMGGLHNEITLLKRSGEAIQDETWPRMSKSGVARQLADHVCAVLLPH